MAETKKPMHFLAILPASLTVFFSGGSIMVLELVATRLIARYLGSSLYTWTAVIGVVLAGITIGNYIGGILADKYKPQHSLPIQFCLCSLSCVVIIFLNDVMGQWALLWELSWPTRIFLHVTLAFLLPSTMLGTISPVVAKMALDRGMATGQTVGIIYAAATAGSIVGVFVAGFYLIANFGTIAIVFTVGGALLLLAVIYRPKFWPTYIWAAIFAAIAYMTITGNTPAA